MTLYNALPRKEYKRVFMCKTAKEVWHTLIITHQGNSQVKDCKIDLFTQQYEKFSISSEETIDSGFTRFNVIVTSLKSLDQDYYNKNHVKALALKSKVTREQTSDDSDNQGGIDEDVDEEEAEAFNLIAKNFRLGWNKGSESSRQKRGCYNCEEEGHFISECPKPKESKAFVGGAWSDSDDGNEPQKDAICLMANDSQEKNALLKKNIQNYLAKSIAKSKEVCLKCDLLPDDWIMDSGCTKHMTGNRRLCTSYMAYDCGHVLFGSNLKGKIIGKGNITHDSITITNVEHVSGLELARAQASPSVKDYKINELVVQDLNGSPSLQVNVSDEGYPKSVKEARGHPIEQVIGEMNERTLRS
ncbi:retrovirus-related pol polyprotein from transposon TNT 1-94 [Tanacetum coccineum]